MTVVAVAYKRLRPGVRKKVDALVRLNPDYTGWGLRTLPPGIAIRSSSLRRAPAMATIFKASACVRFS